jgi:anti-sigma B factor antagonist
MELSTKTLESDILKIEFSPSDGDTDLSDGIEFDIENQGKFVELIETVLDQKSPHILLDMTNITYIDSSGLWALFEGHRKTQRIGRSFFLCNVTKDVKRVLVITQLASKFVIVDSEAEAIKSLAS